jgi:hypothetical protein
VAGPEGSAIIRAANKKPGICAGVFHYFDLDFGAGMRSNNSRNSAASSSFGLAGGL